MHGGLHLLAVDTGPLLGHLRICELPLELSYLVPVLLQFLRVLEAGTGVFHALSCVYLFIVEVEGRLVDKLFWHGLSLRNETFSHVLHFPCVLADCLEAGVHLVDFLVLLSDHGAEATGELKVGLLQVLLGHGLSVLVASVVVHLVVLLQQRPVLFNVSVHLLLQILVGRSELFVHLLSHCNFVLVLFDLASHFLHLAEQVGALSLPDFLLVRVLLGSVVV